jgi:hypothetical protein
MELAGASVLRNVGLCAVEKSPQLTRDPLGRSNGGFRVDKGMTDIQHLSLEVQAAYVALFRLRAALACPSTVTEYRAHDDGPMLSEREAVAFVSALPLPAALNGTIEGSLLRLEARTAEKEASPLPGWSVPERYGPDSAFRAVALQAKEAVLVAHAAAVERSFQEYWLSCPYSLGFSYNDSDGPLAKQARRLGAIACFTLGPPPRIISSWIS